MKNKDRQHANRQKKPRTDEIPYRNHEYYADPTAYYALKSVERSTRRDKPDR